jgi:hypothetical protein
VEQRVEVFVKAVVEYEGVVSITAVTRMLAKAVSEHFVLFLILVD